MNVSVQDIATSNRIKDVDRIQIGEVLNIDVNIQYGYQVSSTIDLSSFTNQTKVQGYNPLSESMLYTIFDELNNYADSFGGSLVDNGGNTRVGRNLSLYC